MGRGERSDSEDSDEDEDEDEPPYTRVQAAGWVAPDPACRQESMQTMGLVSHVAHEALSEDDTHEGRAQAQGEKRQHALAQATARVEAVRLRLLLLLLLLRNVLQG